MEHTKINIEIGYQDTTDDGSRHDRWTEDYSGPHKYWTFPVTMAEVVPIETIAEAAFIADNSPHELTEGSLACRIRETMLDAYRQTGERHHSLSVGDRVRVGEVEVVCSGIGWKRVF